MKNLTTHIRWVGLWGLVLATSVAVAEPVVGPVGTPDSADATVPAGLRIHVFVDRSGEMKGIALPSLHERLLEPLARKGDRHCVHDPEAPEGERCQLLGTDLGGAKFDVGLVRLKERNQSACSLVLDWWRDRVLPEIRGGKAVFAIAYGGPNVDRFPADCEVLARELRAGLQGPVGGFAWVQSGTTVPKDLKTLAEEIDGRFHALVLAEAEGNPEWLQGWALEEWSWNRADLNPSPFLPGVPQTHPMFATVASQGWRPLRVLGEARQTGSLLEGVSQTVTVTGADANGWWLPAKKVGRIDATAVVTLDPEAARRSRPTQPTIRLQVDMHVDGLGTLAKASTGRQSQSFDELAIELGYLKISTRQKVSPMPDELDGEVPVEIPVCEMLAPPATDPGSALFDSVQWSLALKPNVASGGATAPAEALNNASQLRTQRSSKGLVHTVAISHFSREGLEADLSASAEVIDSHGWVIASPACRRQLPIVSSGVGWLPGVVGGGCILAVLALLMLRRSRKG